MNYYTYQLRIYHNNKKYYIRIVNYYQQEFFYTTSWIDQDTSMAFNLMPESLGKFETNIGIYVQLYTPVTEVQSIDYINVISSLSSINTVCKQ